MVNDIIATQTLVTQLAVETDIHHYSSFAMSSTTTMATVAQAVSLQTLSPSYNAVLAANATGGYEYPGIPTFSDRYKKRQWQLEHMAGAFRVFARKGYTEGTAGHISVRDPVHPSTFWINP